MSADLLNLPMDELRSQYPSMKRALFSAFHIGGCQSCAYGAEETLKSVCERNQLDAEVVITEIIESEKRDRAMMVTPGELKTLLAHTPEPLLLDTRTREEHEAVQIPGSTFLTQELQNSLFTPEHYERDIILYDHTGQTSLDTCSWFLGHGLKNTKVLEGGIDRYAQEEDPSLQRYKLELE